MCLFSGEELEQRAVTRLECRNKRSRGFSLAAALYHARQVRVTLGNSFHLTNPKTSVSASCAHFCAADCGGRTADSGSAAAALLTESRCLCVGVSATAVGGPAARLLPLKLGARSMPLMLTGWAGNGNSGCRGRRMDKGEIVVCGDVRSLAERRPSRGADYNGSGESGASDPRLHLTASASVSAATRLAGRRGLTLGATGSGSRGYPQPQSQPSKCAASLILHAETLSRWKDDSPGPCCRKAR